MKRHAFTLLELLIVIAIIAMLISVLIPSLRAAKNQAHLVICGRNMSQIVLGFSIYNNENETFPHGFDDLNNSKNIPPGGFAGESAYDKVGWWWFNYIVDTVPAKGSVVWCPSRKYVDPLVKGNVLCGNYGVNRSVCKDAPKLTGVIGDEFVGRPLGLTQITHPSQVLLVMDSGYSLASWKAATDVLSPRFDNINREEYFYIPGMSINTLPDSISEASQGRHPNKTINVTYTDGHVATVKADKLTVEKIGSKFRNISPLWKP